MRFLSSCYSEKNQQVICSDDDRNGREIRLGVDYSAFSSSMIPHQTFQNQWMQEYGAFYCIFCINHQDNTALQWLKPEVNLNFIKKRKQKKKSRQLVLRNGGLG